MKFAIVICLVGLIAAVSADCFIDYNPSKRVKDGHRWTPDGKCYLVQCRGNFYYDKAEVCNKLIGARDPRIYEIYEPEGKLPYPDCCPYWKKIEGRYLFDPYSPYNKYV